jgi:DNA repair ATPase RecN
MHLHIHHHLANEDKIINQLNKLTMTTQEAIQKINDNTAKLEKVRTEVQNLKDAVANAGNVDPEIEAALGRLDAALTAVDDINPDEVVNPEQPE